MKISIIIPTYNEEEYLPKLLESIKSQDLQMLNPMIILERSLRNMVALL